MIQYKKVAFYTLGCKLNFSETSTIGRLFEDAGFAKVDFTDGADIYVINTCSVTENADKKCKQIVKKALKHNPDAFVIIVGCFAQLKPKEISMMPGVDLVLGANEKFNIIAHLDSLEKKTVGEFVAEEIKHTKTFVPGYSFGDRTRTFLKVQDGCDYFCSFCTIPLARGRSRSANVAATMKTAHEVAATQAQEVVLTGVNIGDFGKGHNETFFDLVKELDTVEGIARFRISSIEPNLLSNDIISYVSSSQRFVPHFHVPLQSGSDHILKQMRRRYDTALYADRIRHIKQEMPQACIGVDVIVGYPGETEEEFLKTYAFLNGLDISYLHVFSYSERDNTTAVRVTENIVSKEDRAKRSKMLHILSDKKKRAFYETQVGKSGTVLWEAEEDGGMMHGFTENYVKVKTAFDADKVNKFENVAYNEIDRDGLMKVSVTVNQAV
jgi:threonylcarbamoyladenosine tRNA methylthiotransferase MtaB